MPITVVRLIIEIFTGIAEIRLSDFFPLQPSDSTATLSSQIFLLKELPAWIFLCVFGRETQKLRHPHFTICKG